MKGSTSFLACGVAAGILWTAAALPAPAVADESRAAVTRPSGSSGSSGSGSAGSSSGGGSVSSGGGSSGGGRATIASDSRGSAGSTRPGATSDGRTVVRDDRRSPRGHGGIHVGFWGYAPWHHGYWGPWGYGYWGHPYGYGQGYPVAYSAAPGYGMGALDLNVRPKDAEVHVNGQYIGLVKQYDGFPSYLWLERGAYEIAFYRPGHETVVRNFEVFTGLVLEVAIELPPGQAVLPARHERGAAPEPPLPRSNPAEGSAGAPAALETGRLELEILPREASVYLDSRFVGTGDELARLHDGLTVEPGAHVLEVLSPGRIPETVHFELAPGEATRIEVRLDPAVDA
jgi:hypothetical protein